MQPDPTRGEDVVPEPVARLAEEFLARYRRGERPALSEYVTRHPELAESIREYFPMLVLMEQAGSGPGNGPGDDGDSGGQGATPPLQQLGDYRILREIGRGGMGVVYEAEQLSLGRRVALKALTLGGLRDGNALARFQREARSTARLHHTNIVPVFEVGRQDEVCYYAMQLILGQGLDQVIEELVRLRSNSVAGESVARPAGEITQSLLSGRLGPQGPPDAASGSLAPLSSAGPVAGSASAGRTSPGSSVVLPGQQELSSVQSDYAHYFHSVARIGQQAAEGLAYAHARGVIHRDVKPSNLLLDGSGVVWVTDFGLAMTEEDALTSPGDVVGTLRYMAPERFRGHCDGRADVYGLGLTLYELLTLKPVFEGVDRLRLIEAVKNREPPRPRAVDPRVPRDLETIVLKAIDKDPARRYPSAQELADDLRRFASDEPIHARRASPAERLARWARHNKVVASLLAALVLVFLAGFVGIAWKWHDAVSEREAKDEQRRQADTAREEAQLALVQTREAQRRTEASLYGSSYVRARLEYQAGHIDAAEESLDRCPEAYRGWEWQFLRQLTRADLFTFALPDGWVEAVAYSPDGRLIAVAGGGNPFFQNKGAPIRPGEVSLWDAVTGTRRQTLVHPHVAHLIAFSPDGRLLASACPDLTARIWDVASGRELRRLRGITRPLRSLTFSLDGQTLAATDLENARLWDVATGAVRQTVPRQPGEYTSRTFSPGGRYLLCPGSGSEAGAIQFRDPATGKVVRTLEGYRGRWSQVAFSPDGRWLAAQTDQALKLWDLITGGPPQTIATGGQSLAFSPDGRYVATGSGYGTVRVWHRRTSAEYLKFQGHRQQIHSLAFSPDGRRLVSGSADGRAKVWDLTRDPEYASVRKTYFQPEREGLAFSADGRHLVLVDGTRVFTLDPDRNALLDIRSVARDPTWLTPAEPVCLDAEGRWVVGTSKNDPRVAVCWEVRTGGVRVTLRGHTVPLSQVTLSRGGRRIATGGTPSAVPGRPAEVKVWDGERGRLLFARDELGAGVTRLALSADGARLAVAGGRAGPAGEGNRPRATWFLEVYELTTPLADAIPAPGGSVRVRGGRLLRQLTGADERFLGLAFSSDGARLAATGDLQTILLWDLASGRSVVNGHGTGSWMDVTFSPDGRRLAVGGRTCFKVLDAGTGDELLELRTEALRGSNTLGVNPRVRFSPDGKRLAALWGPSLSVWSAEEDTEATRAARRQAADERAVVQHLREAAESKDDDPEGFQFHLRCVESLPLASAWDYLLRGRLYERAGRRAAADADFAKAAELAPDNPEVQAVLGGRAKTAPGPTTKP